MCTAFCWGNTTAIACCRHRNAPRRYCCAKVSQASINQHRCFKRVTSTGCCFSKRATHQSRRPSLYHWRGAPPPWVLWRPCPCPCPCLHRWRQRRPCCPPQEQQQQRSAWGRPLLQRRRRRPFVPVRQPPPRRPGPVRQPLPRVQHPRPVTHGSYGGRHETQSGQAHFFEMAPYPSCSCDVLLEGCAKCRYMGPKLFPARGPRQVLSTATHSPVATDHNWPTT